MQRVLRKKTTMGRTKRKNASPLEKDHQKTRRTGQDDTEPASDAEDEGRNREDQGRDVLEELKEFIRCENARNNKSLAEEIRRYNDERISALESSLNFALAANETLGKRLVEVEKRASQAEKDFGMCVKRLTELEGELDQMQQRELKEWLVFSGPAIPRRSQSGGNRDASRLLHAMVQELMDYNMDMEQVAELYREERQIRVRFSAVGVGSDRYTLVRNRTRLRGTGLFIRERLTPLRQHLFNELMQLKRDNKISTVFTRDGTVYTVVGQQDRPRPVRSDAALERLRRQLEESTVDCRRTTPDRADWLAGRRRPQAADRAPHSSWSQEAAAGRGRGPRPVNAAVTEELMDAVESEPVGGAPGPAGRSVSPADHVSDGAVPSDDRERHASERRPAGGAVTSAPASGGGTPMNLAGSGPGAGGADRLRAAPGGGGDAGGGGARGSAVAEGSLPETTKDRPAMGAAGIRRRFGGDIRHFVRVHSKCD